MHPTSEPPGDDGCVSYPMNELYDPEVISSELDLSVLVAWLNLEIFDCLKYIKGISTPLPRAVSKFL